ncbi:MAG: M1 family metallopeptidase [Crocinitomicaceae bacterium]|nr:M1 family metallopeptidase [Crocinitomicaceae bacterium]
MKKLSIIFALFAGTLNAQEYFQQEVNYTIDVRLDDVNNFLHGFEEFEYINNSPDALSEIYIHLWPNAYKNGSSALAKQQYHDGDDQLRHGSDSIRGYIDSLDFEINHQKIKWFYTEEHEDICVLQLATPLKPGERLSVTTPFRVKIPSGSISRLGHVDESYQITQWYPKPAVYDTKGWHEMPYLGQGEFFSEFGSFDVRITLPENYVVGATGDLQTTSEIEYMDTLAAQTVRGIEEGYLRRQVPGVNEAYPNSFPASSETFKTIQFTQSNVHDFAWFADKRYSVLKGEVELPHSGRKVTTWALYTPDNGYLWQDALEYLNDATYYYSLWNGDYPYSQVTAVDGTISAGGGMEYPNVTVIGNTSDEFGLEVVIVHEVGHNWFYGQLGSNERDHGWMDEGINTLNEVRYVQTKYPENQAMSDMIFGGAFHFNDLDHHDLSDISYRTIAWLGEDQAIETKSDEFSQLNYGVVMYQKTGLVFFYLKDYLGEELFDKCMQKYYRDWEFKHPSPAEMHASLEKTSGKDLSWLFDDLINTTNHIDYKIVRAKRKDGKIEVKVRNVGQVDGPIEVNLIQGDTVAQTRWAEPGNKTSVVVFDDMDFEKIVIDYSKDIPELNRQNNTVSAKGLFKKLESFRFEFGSGDNEAETSNIFWTPVLGGNYYDRFMIGAAFHNYGIPFGKVNYIVAPLFSFGRKMISGMGELSITKQPKGVFKSSKFGVSLKSFKHDTTYRNNESFFVTVSPFWQAKIGSRNGADKPYYQTIRVQGLYRKDKFGPTHIDHVGGFAAYNFDLIKPDHKFHAQVRNDFITNANITNGVGRIRIEAEYKFRYMKRKQERWVELRAFYGNQYYSDFNTNGAPPGHYSGYQYSMSLSGTDGQQDIFTEDYFLGRNNIQGLWSQQRSENMGGFRSTSYYGTTDRWLASGNLWMQLPYIPKFFGIFADVGAFDNGISIESAINTGVGINIANTFGLYFPIWMSKELKDSFGNSGYGSKIRLTLNINIFKKPLSLKELM